MAQKIKVYTSNTIATDGIESIANKLASVYDFKNIEKNDDVSEIKLFVTDETYLKITIESSTFKIYAGNANGETAAFYSAATTQKWAYTITKTEAGELVCQILSSSSVADYIINSNLSFVIAKCRNTLTDDETVGIVTYEMSGSGASTYHVFSRLVTDDVENLSVIKMSASSSGSAASAVTYTQENSAVTVAIPFCSPWSSCITLSSLLLYLKPTGLFGKIELAGKKYAAFGNMISEDE